MLMGLTVATMLVAAPALTTGVFATGVTGVIEQVFDEEGRLLYEVGIEPSSPLIGFVKHYTHKPNHGGGGGGGDDGSGTNDCQSTSYKTTGFYWTQPWSAYASSYSSTLDKAGQTWQAETSTNIFGGISSGNKGTAGELDDVNQIDWVNLGSSSTIAVTTTWYYRGSGEAVESDQEYNTAYKWSTSGASDAMDVENIGTHEVGHSFGLDHPNGGGVDCLTMYAYADYGETQKRTLGVGDILGIQALYGS